MDFRNDQAIYLQIADYILEMILTSRWPEGEKIPSIRELAVEIEVNPNTVMRTYNHLQDQEIIFNRRGIGYFVAEEARKKAQLNKKKEFIHKELPRIIKTLDLIGITVDDLGQLIKQQSVNEN